jgi:hypothetical protein
MVGPRRVRRGGGRSWLGCSEQGAVAVEFAIVLPVLRLFVIGMIEFSLVMKDSSGLSATVRVGARTAASGAGSGDGVCSPNAPTGYVCAPAKYSPALVTSAINSMQTAGTSLTPDLIDYVLVYKANASGWPGTTTTSAAAESLCRTTGNDCVKFTYNKVANKFQYASGSWDSSTINACINAAASQSVGVYVKSSHPFMTSLFGSTLKLEDRTVMRFEPLPIQMCNGSGSPSTGGHL